jgi:flagellar biosynthesis protein FliQ
VTIDAILELCRNALFLALTLCGPPILVALVIGLLVGLIQAATQLNDPSLSFAPKLAAITGVVLFLLPWGLGLLTEFSIDLIRGIPDTF